MPSKDRDQLIKGSVWVDFQGARDETRHVRDSEARAFEVSFRTHSRYRTRKARRAQQHRGAETQRENQISSLCVSAVVRIIRKAPKGQKPIAWGVSPRVAEKRNEEPRKGRKKLFRPLRGSFLLVSLFPGLTPWAISVPPLWGFQFFSRPASPR
jgi:hypothetical protein